MSKLRLSYITALIIGIILFNSCCSGLIFNRKDSMFNNSSVSSYNNLYGSYLAGRIAHMRQDFNKAADFYAKALEKDAENQDLLGKTYIILASQGRIHEAAKYAYKASEKGDKNNFIYIIIAVDYMKDRKFQEANEILDKLQGNIYRDFIIPLISSWSYAGMNEQKKALSTLDSLKKEPSFKPIFHFHAGMLNDYFDNFEEAQKHYEQMINNHPAEMSFRALQIISNFYVRTNQKEKAIELLQKYYDEKALADMLSKLKEKIENADANKTPKLIADPNDGVSEALFSIAATLRQGTQGIDLAHIFIRLAIYANPNYDLAKLLLADILESRGNYIEANKTYDEIPDTSETYFTAQMKKATNLTLMKDYKSSELLLKSLELDYKTSPQLYLDLGDVLRLQGKYAEAIKFYKLAIETLPNVENNHWVLFYALGSAYERNNQWDKAETQFRTAMEMSNNHYLVLNYLGYSLIKQNKDIEQAFSMIVDAYNQAPNDGNVADSLGYALYNLGKYDEAITYLEKASELEPASAIIYDHLGDALWQGGYKNEARFQWKHALTMKNETKEVDIEKVKIKLEKGVEKVIIPDYDHKIIEEKIKEIIDN